MTRLSAVFVVTTLISVASTSTWADDVAEAREHFRKGSKAFDLGHYRDAVKEYEAAYNFKEDPALLFNIGQAYRLDGDYQNAIRVYKSFLNRMPDAPNRADVERRIAEMQQAIEQQGRVKEGPPQGTLPPAASTPPPPAATRTETTTTAPAATTANAAQADRRPGRTIMISGLAVAGVGVAALVVGGVFGGLALKASNDLTQLDQNMGMFSAAKYTAGKTDQIVEGVFLGIGGAAVVAGAAMFAVGYRDSKRRLHAMAVPMVSPGLAGIAAKGSF